MDKAKSASISLPESYWEKLKIIAAAEFDGNRTAAIKAMIDRNEPENSQYPIGSLLKKHAPILLPEYRKAIAHESPEETREEYNSLLLYLQQCLKLIHTPDQTDMALMTIGELREAMVAIYAQAKTNPNFQIRDIYSMAYERIKAAKRRKHLKNVNQVPTESIPDDPEIPTVEGGFVWITRKELKETIRDFIKSEDLVPESHIDQTIELLFDAETTTLKVAEEKPNHDVGKSG